MIDCTIYRIFTKHCYYVIRKDALWMKDSYVYRKYSLNAPAAGVGDRIAGLLEQNGYKVVSSEDGLTSYRYPGIAFNSRRPLSCVSRMTVRIKPEGGGIQVRVGMTFTKIRYFTIALIGIICFVLPAMIGYVRYGYPDIPPMAFFGIPLGFMLHYHVRWRVYTALGRLLKQAEYLEQENK